MTLALILLLAAPLDLEDPSVTSDAAISDSEPLDHPFSRVERIIFKRTNELREREGLQAVDRDETLDLAAQWFANFMARHRQYGHEADGREPASRIESAGYGYCRVGENIAWMQKGDETIPQPKLGRKFFEGWRDSPPHRENLLTDAFTQTGLGIARGEDEAYYAVQLFGRPDDLRFRVEIVNRTGSRLDYSLGERDFTLPVLAWRIHQLCRDESLAIGNLDARTVDAAEKLIVRKDGQSLLVETETDRTKSAAAAGEQSQDPVVSASPTE